jgi:uncharacterized protein (TIGR03435 family)
MRVRAAMKSATGSIVLAALVLPAALGQPESPPRFEVVSVKPRVLAGGRGPANAPKTTIDPGMVSMAVTTAAALVEFAYACKSSRQVVGGPDWLYRERYDVIARTTHPATRDQQRLMMQALLADRFQLACHRETREVPGYALLPGKKLKITRAAGLPATELVPPMHSRRGDDPIFTYTEKDVSMVQLADWLWSRYGRPVVDRTGLAGTFDFTLSVTADEAMTPEDFFSAIGEQLGLKLEAQRMRSEVWVIDRIQRASDN